MLWYDKSNFEKAGIAAPLGAQELGRHVLDAAKKLKDAGVQYFVPFCRPASSRAKAPTMQGFYMALLGADVPEGDRNRLLNRETGQWIGDSPAIRKHARALQDRSTSRPRHCPSRPQLLRPISVPACARPWPTTSSAFIASGSWEDACLWDCNGVNLPSREERDAHGRLDAVAGLGRSRHQGDHQHLRWLDHRA
jgi:multiple sugar transport system substrate-binding protein